MDIGGIEVTITSEKVDYPTTVTSRPVEGGVIADNIKVDAIMVEVSGVITKDAFNKLKKLVDLNRKGKLVTYRGRNIIGNLAIEKLTTGHSAKIKNGFDFTASMKQVRIAKAQTVDIVIATAKTQAKAQSAAGRQQPKPKNASPDRVLAVVDKYRGERVTST